MRLDLSSLDLIVSGPTSPGVAAALKVRTDNGETTTIPDFAMGFGMPVPADVRTAFTELSRIDNADDFTIEDGGTWMYTDPTRTDQRWFVQWRVETALICGETSAGGIEADGLTFRNASLRVVLRSGATDANIVRIWIEGEAEFSSDVGALKLRNVAGRFSLEINAENLPDLQRVLENPASVLDGAFTGKLTVAVTAAQIPLLNSVDVRNAEIELSAQASSAAGARRLRLDAATLALGGRLLFAGAELAQSQLEARLGNWPTATTTPIGLNGQGTLTMPSSISTKIGGASIAATLHLRCSATTTHFEFSAAGLRLDPSVNVLNLSSVGVRAVFSFDVANRWSFSAEGTLEQSWSSLANRLRASRLVELGRSESFPDVRATLSVAAQSLPTGSQLTALRIALALELVQQGRPYEGPLGDFPVQVSRARLSIAADIGAAGFSNVTVQAEGSLTITGALKSILPWQNLRLGAEFIGGQELPTLRLTVSGMPPFALPPLKRGGQPISILQIDSAVFELGATLRFGGNVKILPGVTANQLLTRLGVPAEFAESLRPVGNLLVGLQGSWDLTYKVSDGSGSIAISLEKQNPPELDVFEMLSSFFPAVQPPAGGFILEDFTLLKITPGSIKFLLTFGGAEEALVELSAGVSCTVLDEEFDARCLLRMRGARPELELVAGVEKPISISFPGIEALGGNIAQTILNKLDDLYTLEPNDRLFLTDKIQNIRDFFAQPGMDTAAQFELRQLRLVLRPTDTVAPVEISGTLKPVRLPSFVSKVLPAVPSVTLGATARSIFFELSLDDDPTRVPKPLVSVPMGGKRPVDFILRGFKVAYSWDSNSVDLGLEVNINTTDVQLYSEQAGTGVLLPPGTNTAPSVASAFAIKTIASVPPVPVPEWNVTFGDVGNPNNRGMEMIIGVRNQRFLTLNLSKTAFSITRTPFGPGGDFDGGFLFGNPPANDDDVSQFYLRGSVVEGVFITYPSALVPLFNPFGAIFMPPFPLTPMNHGDIFFKQLNLGFNIPGLLFARITLEKPLPEISLLTIVELIFLASKGFTLPLPATSSLRKVFFVALRGKLKLLLPPALFGTENGQRPKMVELLNLNVEFNATDVLGIIGQGLSAGKEIMETAGQGIDAVRDNPNMLIRLIPRDKRSFTFDESLNLAGVKLQLDASVFLLTPEELREELVLFHENRRPFGKGSGRVRLGPAPPARSPVVDRTPTMTKEVPVQWTRIVNSKNSFDSRGAAFQKYLGRKRAEVEENVRQRVNAAFRDTLKPTISDALRRALFDGNVWTVLTNTSRANLRSELEKQGLGYATDLVAQAIQEFRTAQTPARVEQIRNRLVDQIADITPMSTQKPLDLGEDRAVIAARMAAQIVVDVTGSGPGIKVATPTSRQQVIRAGFTKAEHAPVIKALDEIGNKAEEKLRTSPPATKAAGKAFRSEVEQEVLRALNEQAVKHKAFNPAQIDADSFGATKVTNAIMNAFPDRAKEKIQVSKSVAVLNVGKSIGLVKEINKVDVSTVPPEDRVREVTGYQVKTRADVTANNFAVDVPGPHVTFRVEFRQGKFVLVILDSAGNELNKRDIPSAIVGTRPLSPGATAEFSRLFVLAPKVVERAMTNREKAARDDNPQETSTSLYQNSLFARPEYAIPGLEGRRGDLTLADLLRSDGTYIVPGGPVLIAGGKIDLFKRNNTVFELRVTGLLAPPITTGSSGIFFYGHQAIALPLPLGYELRLDGDFHVIAGNMWPATLADPSIVRNSVHFAGLARLRRDGRNIFNGSTTCTFSYPSPGVTNFSISMDISTGDTWELGFEDWSMMKATVEVSGRLMVAYEGGSLSMSFQGSASLVWQVAEFGTRVEHLPSFTACSWTPWGWKCITLGGGTIEHPDPTRLEWQEAVDPINASVSASLDNGRIKFRVSADVPGFDDDFFNYYFYFG